MNLRTFVGLAALTTTLHGQIFIWPGQIVPLGDIVAGVSEPATIAHSSTFVSVSVGEVTPPDPVYYGWAWIAEVGWNDHLRVPLTPINTSWTGTFAIPSELQYNTTYYVVMSFGGFPGWDVNDTAVTYESERFVLTAPPQVPEPASVALLSALGLLAFVGFRKR